MKKYADKYRIESNRLQGWDYGSQALYFITICCEGRQCYFGQVEDGIMVLSDVGRIAQNEWLRTYDLRPDMDLYEGAYVVMPNHFHAVIGIGMAAGNGSSGGGSQGYALQYVSTSGYKNTFGPQSKNLASIVRGFKGSVTRRARPIRPDFGWQPNYHDHIIRSKDAYRRISQYIADNPANWTNDTFYGS